MDNKISGATKIMMSKVSMQEMVAETSHDMKGM